MMLFNAVIGVCTPWTKFANNLPAIHVDNVQIFQVVEKFAQKKKVAEIKLFVYNFSLFPQNLSVNLLICV